MNHYRLLADVILVLHFAYVAFVVGGLAAILLGIGLRWQWVRNFWFRAVHLAMIGIVVLESLCGILCPLTDWEDRLRELGGAPNEPGTSFIGRWAHDLLFVDLPASALVPYYCLFGLAVALTWILAPPRWPWRKKNRAPNNEGGIDLPSPHDGGTILVSSTMFVLSMR